MSHRGHRGHYYSSGRLNAKELNKKSFFLLLCGLGASFLYLLINMIITLVKGTKDMDFTEYEQLGENFEEMFKKIFPVFCIVTLIIATLIYSYLFIRLLKNRKKPASQGYITFLYVISIIGVILNVISLITGELIALIGLAFEVVILIGCIMQRRYNPPPSTPQNDPFDTPQSIDVFPGM